MFPKISGNSSLSKMASLDSSNSFNKNEVKYFKESIFLYLPLQKNIIYVPSRFSFTYESPINKQWFF